MNQKSTGPKKAKEICEDRPRRVKELRQKDKKVVGYLCIYPPLEMITALGLIPYRILGDVAESITEADCGLPVSFCSFARSCFDLGIKGTYEFLDGVVIPHTCEAIEKTAHVWERSIPNAYFHFIDIPATTYYYDETIFKTELTILRDTLEQFAGLKLTSARLKEAIKRHNRQRALLRELYELRIPDPPLISGSETLLVLKAVMSLPVEEGNELLKETITEVKQRKNRLPRKTARLFIWGSIIDSVSLYEIFEDAGATVVMDDTCIGTRAFLTDVTLTDDPMDGLVTHYLSELQCPRTISSQQCGTTIKDRMAKLEDRYGYLKDYLKKWKVNGIILQSLKYCDCHGFEVPEIKHYLDHIGLPNIYLELDYTEGSRGPLKTRIEAFLERIG